MRLHKKLVNEREEYLFRLFLEDPKLSAAKGNFRLQDRFKQGGAPGKMMRPARVYALRNKARAQLKTEGKLLERRGSHVPALRYVIRTKK